MRIIGGKYKGRIFNPGKNFSARPTTDIAKQGLFNILETRFYFEDKSALDLFSGTGSIGYEFVSRGCANTVFVEKNLKHYLFIKEVVKTLNIDNAGVFHSDVFRFLYKYQGKFDLIFADPPYDLQQLQQIPDAVFKAEILNNSGIFILEHPKDYNFGSHSNFTEIRKYGKVNFSFFAP